MTKLHGIQKKMFGFKGIFVVSAIFAYCESASIVENEKKCGLADDECQKTFYNNIIKKIGDAGIPDIGLPSIDPYALKNIEIPFMGMVKSTILDGVAKGFKNCVSTKFHTDAEKLVISIELVCEVFSIDTTYKVESTPTLEALIGSIKISGEGKGGVIIDKLQLNVDIPVEIKKLADGEPHLVIINDGFTYTHQMLGKMVFSGNSFKVGSQEISTVVVNILNENYEFVGRTFGRSVIDKVVEEAIKQFNKFFTAIPIKDFISDDVSSLVSA